MLGFAPTEKLLIIHADDAGMCHSVNRGTTEAMTKGIVNSASIMVPCPWFPEIAAFCREHPDLDFGLHLTLTSEWKYYRWRPVTPFDQVPGLIDPEGFLWRSVEDVVRHASVREVEQELRAQVERARAFGLAPTHLDTHMGTLFARADFFHAYRKVANEYGLPYLFPRLEPGRMATMGQDTRRAVAAIQRESGDTNEYTLDDLIMIDGDVPLERQKQFYRDALRGLRPGITQIIIHCGVEDPELRATSYSHARRDMDRRIFMDPEIRLLIQQQNIRLLTWREIGVRQRAAGVRGHDPAPRRTQSLTE